MSEIARLAACVLLVAGCHGAPDIRVEGCSARVFGTKAGAAYCDVSNRGSGSDLLKLVDSPAAARVELHEVRRDGLVVRMRELTAGLPIPPHTRVHLQPGARHLMLRGVRLDAGAKAFSLRLHFATSGVIEVAVPLVARPES